MRRTLGTMFGLGIIVLGTSLAAEQKRAAVGPWALYVPSEIAWKAGPDSLPPGAKVAVLEGDPAKDGFFTIRMTRREHYNPSKPRQGWPRYGVAVSHFFPPPPLDAPECE